MAKFERIVILTGAGVSAESGIDTFRDAGGLWERHRIEDVATPEGFARDPDLVLGFYDQRREALKAVEPNAAHRALARLEAEFPGELLLVTQNVDNLHERGGSRDVLHMHGELSSALC
ncbi:MAG: Sir2 family NAD-dependent protein deacetylase, partial [Erythrobacter sp.]